MPFLSSCCCGLKITDFHIFAVGSCAELTAPYHNQDCFVHFYPPVDPPAPGAEFGAGRFYYIKKVTVFNDEHPDGLVLYTPPGNNSLNWYNRFDMNNAPLGEYEVVVGSFPGQVEYYKGDYNPSQKIVEPQFTFAEPDKVSRFTVGGEGYTPSYTAPPGGDQRVCDLWYVPGPTITSFITTVGGDRYSYFNIYCGRYLGQFIQSNSLQIGYQYQGPYDPISGGWAAVYRVIKVPGGHDRVKGKIVWGQGKLQGGCPGYFTIDYYVIEYEISICGLYQNGKKVTSIVLDKRYSTPSDVDGNPLPDDNDDPPIAAQSYRALMALYPRPALPAPARITRELVVARYNEDVRWVKDCPLSTVVYNKGPDISERYGRHVRIETAPNVGREASTIFRYIVDNYHNLPDLVFFVQGNSHAGDSLFGRLGVDYTEVTGLTAHYKADFPPAWIKATDAITEVGGYTVRYGQARYHGGREANRNKKWLKSVWDAWFTCPQPEDWLFAYAAEIVVPRHRITDRPLEFWRTALQRVEAATSDPNKWDDNPHDAWACELIHLYLFNSPDKYPVRMDEPKQLPPPKGCWGCGSKAKQDAIRRATSR